MPSQAEQLAGEERRRQALLSAYLAQQIQVLWRGFNTRDVDGAWPAVRAAIVELINRLRPLSGASAASYYRNARALSAPPGRFTPPAPPDLPREQVTTALDVTGPGSFKRAVAAGKTPEQAKKVAVVQVTGAAQRLTQDAGRQVVQRSVLRDPGAIGYARVSDGDPCAFCAMLVSRGAVYKSGKSAGDVRYGGTLYHDHDGCFAMPIYRGDSEWPGESRELYEQWLRHASGTPDPLNSWRRHWENRLSGDGGGDG